ncbi:POLR1B [Symbiodinium sp. CCMP2456]|nr:POLR1B [Symbiodinium sp. CCMP2456]
MCGLRLALGFLACWALASALSDAFAEPLALEASTEVPLLLSFTTGSHPEYGVPFEDDGSTRMMVSFQLTVFCQPQLEVCQYVDLGENSNCRKVLEAPLLPPIQRCVNGPFGIMTLELRGTLTRSTRYDLLVLATLPSSGKRIQTFIVRTLPAGAYLDVTQVTALEEATVQIVPEYVTKAPGSKYVTTFQDVVPQVASPGTNLHQYSFMLAGSSNPFVAGDEIRIFSSPFLFADEGLSFGGFCPGFDVAGFADPLMHATCTIESMPEDGRAGYNMLVLRFSSGASLGTTAQYFRVSLATAKGDGSIGYWYAASRDGAAVFDKVIAASRPFFVEPQVDVLAPGFASALTTFAARQPLQLTVFPRVNILGSTANPEKLRVISPTFHSITSCSVDSPRPEVQLVGLFAAAYCELFFEDNQNLYAHQAVRINLDVTNPEVALPAEDWQVIVESADGSMSATTLLRGWPVVAALQQAFLVPMTMEFAKWNEVQLYFKPRSNSPEEARALLVAPSAFRFEVPCAFEISAGFPDPGVTCSNPLSDVGRNLFSLQLPMSVAFFADTFYAANVFPLRNPYPGSFFGLDDLPWRIDILTRNGEVLETSRSIPFGPYLQGFSIYPRVVSAGLVQPAVRAPSVQNVVTLRFRLAVAISVHGERLRITAPHGYRWPIGGDPKLFVRESPVTLSTLVYDPSFPPAVEPQNQLELTLVNPQISAGSDMRLEGTVWNAARDPELQNIFQSANVWMLEMYEPGAGYLFYETRKQAGILPGFALQAITGAEVLPWLPLSSTLPLPIMISFRLGTSFTAPAGVLAALELLAPSGFSFSEACTFSRISPLHLEVDGFTWLPEGSLSACAGLYESPENQSTAEASVQDRQVALLSLFPGTTLQRRLLYALYVEVFIPSSFPLQNSWRLRVFRNDSGTVESATIPGFRQAEQLLSASYHPGTVDTGEDLRSGASENRVMFSLQAAATVPVGGALRITAPYRFTFAVDCLFSISPSAGILAELQGAQIYEDLPRLQSCVGLQNTARLLLAERMDAAIRYSFRLAVANPALPHPSDWPFPQDIWRFETLDAQGGVLDVAQVKAFFLWTFTRSILVPFVLGAAEQGVVSVELAPSLTLPPLGSVLITAPPGFQLLAEPCVGFFPDTFGSAEGFSPLPAGTTCMRGPGGPNVVKLQLDDFSYLAAGVFLRFKLGVVNPSQYMSAAEDWFIASVEQTDLGDSYLEQNPAVAGFSVHLRLASFELLPSSANAARAATVRIEFSLPEDLGVFQVVSSTEESFIVVDMPPFFVAPTEGAGNQTVEPVVADFEAANILLMKPCASFTRISPDADFFPTQADACIALPGANSFRLLLTGNLDVGPSYIFEVGVYNPALTAVRQHQISQANFWQLRLVRRSAGRDSTAAGRAATGYQLLPVLQDCTITAATSPIPVGFDTTVEVAFRPVSPLSAASGDRIEVRPPASLQPALPCTISVDGAPVSVSCFVENSSLVLRFESSAIVLGDSQVLAGMSVNSGGIPLTATSEQNRWAVVTQNAENKTWDEAPDVPGFTIFPRLEDARVNPKDVSSMSFANHAEFSFASPVAIPSGSSARVVAPGGFTLFAATFAAEFAAEAVAVAEAEVIVWILAAISPSQQLSFRLTVGNPAVSPPQNQWTLEVQSPLNDTLALDRDIPGFVVQSSFNSSFIEADVNEPLAENYVHITLAVTQPLFADSFGQSQQCASSDKLCVYATWLEVVAPEGFVFAATCGFWVLQRVGSAHRGLPPGSLCLADPDHSNIARVRLSLTLEAFTLYEFTLQVRNALSVPLHNVWELRAVQDGIVRERDANVEGFALRQLRTVRVTPVTTLAGAVDNAVTALLRSERPIPPRATVTMAAPLGFIFDASEVSSSFQQEKAPLVMNDVTSEDGTEPSGATIRFYVSPQDYVQPNTYFFVSARIRNPSATPSSNYWYFYIQSQFMEHIDLRKFLPGFVMSYQMPYFQVYPNSIPWNLGTANDISLLFVTSSVIFMESSDALPGTTILGGELPEIQAASWQLLLVAPSGFSFPTRGPFSESCSGFQRWGGKESYDQLPNTQGTLRCTVRNARTVVLDVPATYVNETRYSFRLNVTVADQQEDVALQQPWTLTVLESGQILHTGESPSPLLGVFYEAQWFWAPGSLVGQST